MFNLLLQPRVGGGRCSGGDASSDGTPSVGCAYTEIGRQAIVKQRSSLSVLEFYCIQERSGARMIRRAGSPITGDTVLGFMDLDIVAFILYL